MVNVTTAAATWPWSLQRPISKTVAAPRETEASLSMQ
jgi:hypothetical protein